MIDFATEAIYKFDLGSCLVLTDTTRKLETVPKSYLPGGDQHRSDCCVIYTHSTDFVLQLALALE